MPSLDTKPATTTIVPPVEKAKKIIRQAVGAIVIDSTNNKVLMVSSRNSENTYRLPRGNCVENEVPEQAIKRILHDEAGVKVDKVTTRIATYTEANKKGKIIGHHWMYEVKNPKLLDSWPALDRKRAWFKLDEAIDQCADRHISRLALKNCSLSSTH